MSEEKSSDGNEHVYPTRLRGRMAHIKKKYDDIFSSVVEKARSDDSLRMSPPPIPRKRFISTTDTSTGRKKSNSVSSSGRSRPKKQKKYRSISESGSDSLGTSDTSRDSDGEDSLPNGTKRTTRTAEAASMRFVCECGHAYATHQLLHKHLAVEHSPSIYSNCTKCGKTTKELRESHVCRICDQFALSMDDHLRSHYQDRSGRGALMECRHCYKTFETLELVSEHEHRVHLGGHRSRFIRWSCKYCNVDFTSRHMRDSHLVSHIDQAVGGVWERIAKMQEVLTDQILVNQCPMCHSVMGSRKSFRLHIIHKHLLHAPENFIVSLGLPTMDDVMKTVAMPPVPFGSPPPPGTGRVKTEPIEEPVTTVVKQEPIGE